jgi:hypothetical protein
MLLTVDLTGGEPTNVVGIDPGEEVSHGAMSSF